MNAADYGAAQIAAVQTDAPRVLVKATAGAGKTRVLVGHIEWLVERGVPPNKIVAITFTTAAAAVLTQRLAFKLAFAGTLHSFMLRLLNAEAEKFRESVGVIDAETAATLLEKLAQDHRYKGTKEAVAHEMRRWLGVVAHPSPAQNLVAAYRKRLRDNEVMDFDGLLHYGQKLVEKTADWPFTHLVVDEFQDTAPSHAAIYDAMACKQRYVVGDPEQAIYSFMGATNQNILREAGSATVFKILTNYRSASSICAAATNLIRAGGGSDAVSPRPGAPTGRCEARSFADFQSEAKWVAQTIRELECEDRSAVLLRTNALAADYRLELENRKVRVAQRERVELPPDWKAVKAMVGCLQSPYNDLLAQAFVAALKGTEQAEASWREAVAKQVSVNDHCLHFPPLLTAAEAFEFVASRKPSEAALGRLQAALDALPRGASVGDYVVALSEPQKAKSQTPGVYVGTIHSSKGLEFGTVFLCAAEEGVLPSRKDAADAVLLSEARRLAYVGITRAEQNCFLTCGQVRRERWGAESRQQPSRFITEAGLLA